MEWSRRYVEVVELCRLDGSPVPLAVLWEDGRAFAVSPAAEPVRARCPRTGGYAERHDVVVRGRRRSLWRDDGRRWFVEIEGPPAPEYTDPRAADVPL